MEKEFPLIYEKMLKAAVEKDEFNNEAMKKVRSYIHKRFIKFKQD